MAMIERRRPIGEFFLWLFLIALVLICIVPFYIMIVSATRGNVELSQGIYLWPGEHLRRNYQIIQNKVNIWRGFLGSTIIAVPSVILSAVVSAMTAYGFAKFKFKGRETLFWVVLGTMMVPGQLGLIGYYNLCIKLGIIDTYLPLILPTAANAGMVFFVRAYIESSIPDSLVEAGIIDGAGELYVFWRLIFPLAMPSVATMSIFTFIGKWNDLMSPLVLLNSAEKFPMPVVISNIQGLYETNYGAIYLGVAISVIPIIIVVVLFSKAIIRGLTIGSVKG